MGVIESKSNEAEEHAAGKKPQYVVPLDLQESEISPLETVKLVSDLTSYDDSNRTKRQLQNVTLAQVEVARAKREIMITKIDNAHRSSGRSSQQPFEFVNQVARLSKLQHANVLPLLGYCDSVETGQRVLLYQYMSRELCASICMEKGRTSKLRWKDRLRVALECAKGLEYLHETCKPSIIHGNISSNTIFIDEKYVAKIAECGVTGLVLEDEDSVSAIVTGPFDYLDPQYWTTRRLTKKSDVYSFGVLLFEIICGRPPYVSSTNRQKRYLVKWAADKLNDKDFQVCSIVDPAVRGKYDQEDVKNLANLALCCIQPSSSNRPKMEDVVRTLTSMMEEIVEGKQGCALFKASNVEESLANCLGQSQAYSLQAINDTCPDQTFAIALVDSTRSQAKVFGLNELQVSSYGSRLIGESDFGRGVLEHGLEVAVGGISKTKLQRDPESSVAYGHSWIRKGGVQAQLEASELASHSSDGETFMREIVGAKPRAFTLEDVELATSNRKQLIGRGAFGYVYYGKIEGGVEVAVKINESPSFGHGQGANEFVNEVCLLSRIHHRNIVSLLGYCVDNGQRVLIYDYVPNGTLRQHLHGTKGKRLSWNERLKIAVDAATGLEYLHNGCEPKIIHRDVKSDNILLERKEDGKLVAKVADFGISKLCPDDHSVSVITNVKGTIGYLDPEYYRIGKLTLKSDVYSSGVVLLELVCGRPPNMASLEDAKQRNLVEWGREKVKAREWRAMMDGAMGDYSEEAVKKVANLAGRCVEEDRCKRPDMATVLRVLTDAQSCDRRPSLKMLWR